MENKLIELMLQADEDIIKTVVANHLKTYPQNLTVDNAKNITILNYPCGTKFGIEYDKTPLGIVIREYIGTKYNLTFNPFIK